jgi:predicted RNA-binding Zn ribbon-like protein
METSSVIDQILIVGGSPALDLTNTRDTGPDGEPGFDRLLDYDHLLAWAVRAGVVSESSADRARARAVARPDEASAALAQARALRADLYDVFNALALDREPPKSSMSSLRRVHGEAIAHGSLRRRTESFSWDWSDNDELVGVLWPIVHAAIELLTSDEVLRVKRCHRCSWLFLDATKNRSRRWCSMEGCGTNEKSERFVRRRRAQRGSG